MIEISRLVIDIDKAEPIYPSVGPILHVVRIQMAQAADRLPIVELIHIHRADNGMALDVMDMPI